jgi:predicted enzyme related to lactoylglutathione lyase
MSLRLDCFAFDAHDPQALGRWWGELLGWAFEVDDDGDAVVTPPDGGTPLAFFQVDDEKAVKNRLHLDLRPDDRDAEVARAEAMGATRVDIGQGEQTWVVLADPEGTEFCILRARPPEGS